jgi:N-methylhydantoinase A
VAFVADMRYRGQGYEIPVALEDFGALEERFNALHERLYGFRMPGTQAEIVNLRAVASGEKPSPKLPEGEPNGGDPAHAIVDETEILHRGQRLPTPIYDRARLHPGHALTGPAIVTEFDSTTVVLPGYAARVDRTYTIVIEREGS